MTHLCIPTTRERASVGWTDGDGEHGFLDALIEPDGDVLVLDDVAGHYTRTRELTAAESAYVADARAKLAAGTDRVRGGHLRKSP